MDEKIELSIENTRIGDGHPVFVIAEACDNHMGDIDVAMEMVRQAKLSGNIFYKWSNLYRPHFIFQQDQKIIR